ncbi:hypothetical protein pdam_00014907 [Pocillopora damicornis]|uniref:Uncharacterized protein n=1 Tax=Pocillopora damicornis TaxID=46731 RepID=A0A3M6UK24_POCDA|nr:hypothetical protein pdam_00014907 [Pocillopora damicornis]
MEASPDLIILGLSSNFLPERRSIFSSSSANLQAIWAVNIHLNRAPSLDQFGQHVMITRNVTETHLVGFLLELFDGSFIDSTAFVDQMASGSRFSRIYVTDDNDVDMSLFLCHCCALDLLLLDEMI